MVFASPWSPRLDAAVAAFGVSPLANTLCLSPLVNAFLAKTVPRAAFMPRRGEGRAAEDTEHEQQHDFLLAGQAAPLGPDLEGEAVATQGNQSPKVKEDGAEGTGIPPEKPRDTKGR